MRQWAREYSFIDSSKMRSPSSLALRTTRLGRRPPPAGRPGGRVTAARAKEFLEEAANLRDDLKSVDRLRRRFGSFLWIGIPLVRIGTRIEGSLRAQTFKARQGFDMIGEFRQQIWPVRNLLRAIWQTRDAVSRERLSASFYYWALTRSVPGWPPLEELVGSETPLGPYPPQTELEEVAAFLLMSLGRLRVCRNRDCPQQRFFVAVRRRRQFCSTECTEQAQRQYKLRWWHEHGQQRRMRRAEVDKHERRKSRRKRG